MFFLCSYSQKQTDKYKKRPTFTYGKTKHPTDTNPQRVSPMA